MRITPVDYTLRVLDSGGPKRSTKYPHVSDIIRDLALRGGALDKKYENSEMDAERVELGIAWEERLAKHLNMSVIFHPGEIITDGIAMTIDGISYNDGDVDTFVFTGEGALHEMKLTWKSNRKDINEQWMWLVQIKAHLQNWKQSNQILHYSPYGHNIECSNPLCG